jgi:hypothetical protein
MVGLLPHSIPCVVKKPFVSGFISSSILAGAHFVSSIIIVTLGLFFVAAFMEICGGYLVWQWIREKKGILIGLTGGII